MAIQHTSTTSSFEAVRLLERFCRGDLLRPSSTDLLMCTVLSTATGADNPMRPD